MDKKLSIVIPTYNSIKYIDRCISSIFSQSYKNIEVILVDDGSIDGTYEKSKEIALQEKRVKSYKINHGGASACRNFGISKVSGEFLMFVDSDDALHQGSLKKIMDLFNDNEIDMVVFRLLKIWEDGNQYAFEVHKNKKIDYMEYAQSIAITDDGLCGGGYTVNKVVRISSIKKYFNKIPLFDNRFFVYEDKLWFLKIARAFRCIYISDIIGYVYYIRKGSLSSNITPERMINHYDAINEILFYSNTYNFCNKTIIKYGDNIRTHILFTLYHRKKYKGKGLKSKIRTIKFFNLSHKNRIKYFYLFLISFIFW